VERVKQRLATARQALDTLEELREEPYSKIVRDAAIQRFEYTFEAVWKAAQRHLEIVEGVQVGSPKGAFRACFEAGILTSSQTQQALGMTDDRNLTAHTYNEQVAVRIYSRIPNHATLMSQLLAVLERRLSGKPA